MFLQSVSRNWFRSFPPSSLVFEEPENEEEIKKEDKEEEEEEEAEDGVPQCWMILIIDYDALAIFFIIGCNGLFPSHQLDS